MNRILLGLALVLLAASDTPIAHADPPTPGSGDPLFIMYMTGIFKPPVTEAAARALIPLAHQVCDAEDQGQDDLQAARIVLAGHGVEKLNVPNSSQIGDEKTALAIVNVATLAYCPTHNSSDW